MTTSSAPAKCFSTASLTSVSYCASELLKVIVNTAFEFSILYTTVYPAELPVTSSIIPLIIGIVYTLSKSRDTSTRT
jgi:hypothetical protein